MKAQDETENKGGGGTMFLACARKMMEKVRANWKERCKVERKDENKVVQGSKEIRNKGSIDSGDCRVERTSLRRRDHLEVFTLRLEWLNFVG